jgi:hypothetical protein
MAVATRLIASYNGWRDKARLNRIIKRQEVHSENELGNNGIKAGTLFEDPDGRRFRYMGQCNAHINHCGVYMELDKNDLPMTYIMHIMGIRSRTMKEIGFYSPRDWIKHLYNNKSPSEILKLIEEKDHRVI